MDFQDSRLRHSACQAGQAAKTPRKRCAKWGVGKHLHNTSKTHQKRCAKWGVGELKKAEAISKHLKNVAQSGGWRNTPPPKHLKDVAQSGGWALRNTSKTLRKVGGGEHKILHLGMTSTRSEATILGILNLGMTSTRSEPKILESLGSRRQALGLSRKS